MNDYFKNVWLGLWTVLIGMRITMKHLFAKNVTVQYPNHHPSEKAGAGKMPVIARNRIFVDMDECNGCLGCMRACPVNCITVETIKVAPGDYIAPLKSGGKRSLWVAKHDIDFSKCCFCSLCIEPCPTGAIKMTTEFEYSTYDRKDFLYHFANMTPDEVNDKREKLRIFNEEKKKAEEAKKAAEAQAKSNETGNN